MTEKSQFYVGIKEPMEVRKDLLLSSKTLLTSLKRYERYKQIRDDKRKRIFELKTTVIDLSRCLKKISEVIPKTPKIKQLVEKKELSSEEQVELSKKYEKSFEEKPSKKQLKNAEDVFEEKLKEIEEKLSKLH